jgi:transcriptional regulator with XRE-family HTH domain
MGYIPTAMRCNPYGTKGPSTQFGTWYVDKKVADKLIADRRAGRPMPWHGKPMADNLRATYKLWNKRKHPATCPTCAQIWGKKGAPKSYEDYAKRYPALAHGAKRHLTREWTPGMTISEVAKLAGTSQDRVRRAMNNGMLVFLTEGKRRYVSRTDATRWKARKCPTGDSEKSWISLDTARKLYLFTLPELRRFIASKCLKSQVGTNGAMRGVTYVSRHQCAKLREQIGFTEEQAARRVGVTVGRLKKLLQGMDWRGAKGIPLVTVQAVIKRLQSRQGYTIEEAALKLGQSVQWVQARITDGTIKVNQAKWDRRRVYITEPMLARLEKAKLSPVKVRQLGEDWLRLSDAALEAGVTSATIIRWAETGELKRRQSNIGWRYHREAVRARSRTYWQTVRFHRATPPDWLLKEQEMMKKAA